MITASLKTFCVTVEVGSYIGAAELLNVEHSTISRQIAKLEKYYGAKLIIATPRGLQLTPEGDVLYQKATVLNRLYDETFMAINETKTEVSGPLNIITSVGLSHWLAFHIDEFLEAHPNLEVSVNSDHIHSLYLPSQISGPTIGLASVKADKDSTLVWDPVIEYNVFPYAHPTYLEKYGTPQSFKDLDHHRIIKYEWAPKFDYLDDKKSNPLLHLGRENNNPRRPFLTMDDTVGCRAMLLQGQGIGLLPNHLAQDTPLVKLFNESYEVKESLEHKLYLVYPTYLGGSSKLKAFKQFVKSKAKT